MSEALTLHEAAKVCGVSPNTVRKWFDGGHLRGWRVPDTFEPKIPRSSVVEFLQQRGLSTAAVSGWPELVIDP